MTREPLETAFEEVMIENTDSDAFEMFYEIYVEALPDGERKPMAEIESLVSREDYSIMGLSKKNQVIAFLIAFHSRTASVGLLEYMATKRGMRNMGLGARLFQMALKQMRGRVMLVEIDSDREQSPDQELRARRKNFYLRQGCSIIEGLDYKMPPVSDQLPPMMDLLIYNPDSNVEVSADRITEWLQTIYVEVYGRDRHDAAIEDMVAGWIGATKTLGPC